jgi:hypothetical protein
VCRVFESMKSLRVFCVLCALVSAGFGLDREAFTFTRYDLDVRIEPEQQRLAVRGKLTLRNDSAQAQRNAVLQVSSTLDWRAIKAEDKAVQFVSQAYTSDIDHTGALSEAIVTLPRDLQPGESIELEIGYEGTIPQSTTRLTRIGTPEDVAKQTDWDQISPAFTAVRGVGYVVWYPVAMEAQNLSDGNAMFAALGQWKARHRLSVANFSFVSDLQTRGPLAIRCNGEEQSGERAGVAKLPSEKLAFAQCSFGELGLIVPGFVMAPYATLDRDTIAVAYLPEHKEGANTVASSAAEVVPFVTSWFGPVRGSVEVLDLPFADAAPFESGRVLMTSLARVEAKLIQITVVHSLTHAAVPSARAWIYEGLAHFAQALYREKQAGRTAALDYLRLHSSATLEADGQAAGTANTSRSLINTSDEILYRSKASCVWWMLRDMVGDDSLRRALHNYRPEQDKEPAYFQRLLSAQTSRDLEWFFDDWVYRDRGLPDFRVQSAFPRDLLNGGFVTTVTVENLGLAGAEVPVTLRMQGGEVTKRLEVRGKSKATIRIPTPAKPLEVIVNDGSVPESDLTNNTLKME